jgi:hypothetical protein
VGGTARSGRWRFSGRPFTRAERELIGAVVRDFPSLSRMELAHTVCELLGWRRPSGRLKGRECREFLERLDADGVLQLPGKRSGRPVGSKTHVPTTACGEPQGELVGEVGDVAPVVLEVVRTEPQRLAFRELVGRHHYLGHAVPFGAQLRYLAYASQPERRVVACLQFSSPAWRMAMRDAWIAWDEAARRRNLQRVVNNSRFLILPWVRVRNLASMVLAQALRRLPADWQALYSVTPMLVETLVDSARFPGHCYRAANFLVLGPTTGRGRMDRERRRDGTAVKTVLVYPLVKDARQHLRA